MSVATSEAPRVQALIDPAAFDRALASTDQPLRLFRQAVRDAGRSLYAQFDAGIPAQALVRERARLVDHVLRRAWRRCGLFGERNVALVAVGGYGRGELHPGSDIDILILLAHEPDPRRARRIREFVTFLWDIGLQPGHSVRTLDECIAQAQRDITVATNLMEARLLSGSRKLFQGMRDATSRNQIWPSRQFFEAKYQEQRRRHRRFHDTAYNLEPNVKEGPGGLRDIQMVGWVVKRHFGADTLHELVTHGFLTEHEYQSLIEGQNFLWQVRFSLHLLTGRREDRLLFDYQRAIAERFGYRDRDHNLAVEQFMKRYYRTVMELGQLNEMLLELFQEVILHADCRAHVIPVNERFHAHNGYLEAADDRVFKRDPVALLEVFLILQEHPDLEGIRASTIRLIRNHRYLIDDALRAAPRAHRTFMSIIRHPRAVSRELLRMQRYGVLGAYLPAFGAITGQMQYDLFHAYTVDQHSLFVVRNLQGFGDPDRYREFPLCTAIFQRTAKPEILYLAGLFHDIAKGRGGDHSELGAEDALEFCRRHGMSDPDAQTVAWLVRHHLLMSVTAQRQDIHDPAVVNQFAAEVGNRERLDYLYLLSVADIRGTNPKLWNDWKDTLLRDLYDSALRVLRRGLENPIDAAELVEETRAQARRLLETQPEIGDAVETLWRTLEDDYFLMSSPDEIAWQTRAILVASKPDLPLVMVRQGRGGTEVFTYTWDQEFLFAAATATLGRLGLNIVNARIVTAKDGMTLDSYVVLEDGGEAISDPEREEEIRRSVKAALRCPRDAISPVKRIPRRQLRHFPIPTRVRFRTDCRNERTIMEVITGDRPGLLARIGRVLADERVRLQNAKIATFGERAEDTFFVTDRKNRPLGDDVCSALRDRLVSVLDEAEGAPGG
ncbi:MAG: [protein-PII] uridylyltransferase [Gammaproteobacteria bacterium]|nr:[protein-PII] uridylyltransferase [Gammaproteobacteria bacterium]NIR84150.1 [protein-PII] uridylyltransferase [Gammaproteobacteria bacterium]NIR89462.1 [protein-PII] uridylyltransferase [Gammaproteobacteria bacterium]NIU05305.1 [protein-PII] uridylyltransferase [Gammaproteobacteria bacterium]NIV52245.1 [protein-PII] uridylyltransferase [Gammaproteobacteria bacterium]